MITTCAMCRAVIHMIAMMIRASYDDLSGTARRAFTPRLWTCSPIDGDGKPFVWRNVREGLVARRSYQSARDNTYRAFSFFIEGSNKRCLLGSIELSVMTLPDIETKHPGAALDPEGGDICRRR